MSIWAVIPMKALERAKTRLSAVLSLQERQNLVLNLFEHTLQELSGLPVLAGILVISPDVLYAKFSTQYYFEFILETQPTGLNESIRQAAQHLHSQGVDAMLVIHGDLPWIRRSEILNLLQHAPKKGVVLVPDRHHSGTNLLLAAPPQLIPFAYGENSFQKHQELASKAGFPAAIFESPSLALDIDIPEDLALVTAMTPKNSNPSIMPASDLQEN